MVIRYALLAVMVGALAQAATPEASQGYRSRTTVTMPQEADSRRVQEEWGYANAIVAGDLIFLSGVVAILRPTETNYEAAYVRAFEQIGESLREVGSSWDDVVEISSFHTDLTSQMPAMKEVKHRYVKAPFPAWTAVGVTRLIPNAGITEIRVVAARTGTSAKRK